ncbi:MAG: acetate--CoA ligase family protein [Proteobacteria bacterium]|nr:acetate--CoA ligase family protein [Pseudomonadota bacterium]
MNIDRIMRAKSVAVIGASKDETKRGFQAIKILKQEKFEGKIYPISLREEKILGLTCYKNINDVAEDIDLALITTPAKTMKSVLMDCGKKGVAGAVIIAGGFGEQDQDGKLLEDQVVSIAKQHGVRLIGPNTSGMINVHTNMNLVGLKDVPKGNIALITQSGNIALHLITEARLKSQKGFSFYVGVGNETDIKFHEYLEFLENDDHTKAILLYVEGMKEGRKFLQQAYRTTRKKPVILLKSGRSATGKRAAGSHTGALAGISEVSRTAFRRSGIIDIENADELFPVAETLSSLPPIKNNKVAILTDGGGHATIAADLMADYGVDVPVLREKTQALLKEVLPPNASVQNPVDVAGGTDADPEIFAKCAKILLNDGQIGGLLIAGLFGGYGLRFAEKLTFIEEDAAHQMGKLVKKTGKPIVLQSLYNFARPHSLDLLRYYDIPVYDSLDIACKCIAALSHYGSYLRTYHKKTSFIMNWRVKAKKEGELIIQRALSQGRNVLLENEAKAILHLHGVPVTSDRIATTADEACAIAKEIGEEVVLKIVSPDILHKTDAGGVKLKLKTEAEVKDAFNEIIDNAKRFDEKAEIKGCLVSRMMEEGMEIIIGTKIDDQFGPVIMFGIGGIMVEILKDVSFRVLPLSRSAAGKMIKEIKSAPILDGVRGKPPVDKKAIIDLLVTVSEIIEAYPQIHEMDLNPVIVHEEGMDIVDARIIL